MNQQNKSTMNQLIVLLLFVSLTSFGGTILINKKDNKGGWRGFGNALSDSSADTQSNEFMLDVNWSNATWGVGALFELEAPINGKKVKAIRADIKTVEGSQTRVIAGLATAQEANISQNSRLALKTKDEWKTMEFPISEMRPDKPEKTSPDFTEADWQKIKLVKLIFLKPAEMTSTNDIIRIRNPELIFEDEFIR
jgi:hypothetical protein